MKRAPVLFSIFFCTVLLNSCDLFKGKKESSKRDTFYTDNGGFDRPRMPLVKPYGLFINSVRIFLIVGS